MGRKGTCWEDRYHAAAIESGEHPARCRVYLDANMVRAGAVTRKGGPYRDRRYEKGKRSLSVSLQSGMGDVVGELDGIKIVAECKGGIINTKHPGQKSKLRQGLREAVGLLMSRENPREKQYVGSSFNR